MVTTRNFVVLALGSASALACLCMLACEGETQERPLRSSSDEARRMAASSSSSPPPAPFPDTAFQGADPAHGPPEPAAPSRFATRRIGAETAPPGRYRGATVDLDLKNADLPNVFRLLADVGHVNIVVAGELSGTVTMRLRRVPWDQALDVIARAKELDVEHDGNVIVVTQRRR